MKSLCIFISAAICMLANNVNSLDIVTIDCKSLTELLELDSPNQAYLPHEDNCGEFYQCGAGGAAKFNCGEGAFFSIKTKLCGHAASTRCVKLKDYLKKKNIKLESFIIDDYPEMEEETSSVKSPGAPKITDAEPLGRAGPKYQGNDDD